MSTYLDGIENGIWYLNGMVKEAYLGSELVYQHSSGVDITYMVDTDVVYTEHIDTDTSILSPTTFTPAKDGYEFVGWREDTVASGDVLYEAFATENTTLYAAFKKTITVMYDANGGTGSTSDSTGDVYYNNGNTLGATISLRSNGFSKLYYTFTKWAMGSASGTQYSAGDNSVIYDDTTFYAVWDAVKPLYLFNNGTNYH